jgi:hypothetical protein
MILVFSTKAYQKINLRLSNFGEFFIWELSSKKHCATNVGAIAFTPRSFVAVGYRLYRPAIQQLKYYVSKKHTVFQFIKKV